MQHWLQSAVALGALVTLAACSRTTASPSETPATDRKPASATERPPQTLKLTHAATTVGAEVHVSASDLPAGKTVDLAWKTVTGGWEIEDYYHFRGKKYTESTFSLGRFTVDASGHLDARFTIPEDYG